MKQAIHAYRNISANLHRILNIWSHLDDRTEAERRVDEAIFNLTVLKNKRYVADKRLLSIRMDETIVAEDSSTYGDWYRNVASVIENRKDRARNRLKLKAAGERADVLIIRASGISPHVYLRNKAHAELELDLPWSKDTHNWKRST